jgi:hypothetical protein
MLATRLGIVRLFDTNPNDCTICVCGAGDLCVSAPKTGTCTLNGVAGTCVEDNCTVLDPTNGGDPDPGGANPDPGGANPDPGGRNLPLGCNGVCNRLLDAILCPSDCANQ